MNFIIRINTDNAAFDDNVLEIHNVLKVAARAIETGTCNTSIYYLYDSNGNKCGYVEAV